MLNLHLERNTAVKMYKIRTVYLHCHRFDFNEHKYESLRPVTTHLSMQHCFSVVFYIIGTYYCIRYYILCTFIFRGFGQVQ